ncbi:hypothetical protein ACLOJK_002128 [Asimina triloba]
MGKAVMRNSNPGDALQRPRLELMLKSLGQFALAPSAYIPTGLDPNGLVTQAEFSTLLEMIKSFQQQFSRSQPLTNVLTPRPSDVEIEAQSDAQKILISTIRIALMIDTMIGAPIVMATRAPTVEEITRRTVSSLSVTSPPTYLSALLESYFFYRFGSILITVSLPR